ncbi:hypothetical protein BJ875DRAFT_487640 [Amylocarpus encephaloides]|uniref:DUF7918 domain-containing protein n=1 Tax=Amylocarpus encephaloides TaxID=45428 RepID=A0A9P7YC63_9HELO|nr:hypothetical protein BJ875DRAFT_487640 [Amylocarpus encephaloides]
MAVLKSVPGLSFSIICGGKAVKEHSYQIPLPGVASHGAATTSTFILAQSGLEYTIQVGVRTPFEIAHEALACVIKIDGKNVPGPVILREEYGDKGMIQYITVDGIHQKSNGDDQVRCFKFFENPDYKQPLYLRSTQQSAYALDLALATSHYMTMTMRKQQNKSQIGSITVQFFDIEIIGDMNQMPDHSSMNITASNPSIDRPDAEFLWKPKQSHKAINRTVVRRVKNISPNALAKFVFRYRSSDTIDEMDIEQSYTTPKRKISRSSYSQQTTLKSKRFKTTQSPLSPTKRKLFSSPRPLDLRSQSESRGEPQPCLDMSADRVSTEAIQGSSSSSSAFNTDANIETPTKKKNRRPPQS